MSDLVVATGLVNEMLGEHTDALVMKEASETNQLEDIKRRSIKWK